MKSATEITDSPRLISDNPWDRCAGSGAVQGAAFN